MLRIGLCEDNKWQNEYFTKKITEYNLFADAKVISATSSKDLLNNARKKALDIAFLDIQLGNENGIDLAINLKYLNKDCIIVFITGYRDYALDAYKVNPLTYLLKPVKNDDFEKCMLLVKERYEEKCALKEKKFELIIQAKEQVVKVKFSDIYYFEKCLQKIIVYTVDQSYEFYGSLKKLRDMKGFNFFFVQCHQGFIINKNKIIKFAGDSIELDRMNYTIPVSRRYKSNTKEAFERS